MHLKFPSVFSLGSVGLTLIATLTVEGSAFFYVLS